MMCAKGLRDAAVNFVDPCIHSETFINRFKYLVATRALITYSAIDPLESVRSISHPVKFCQDLVENVGLT